MSCSSCPEFFACGSQVLLALLLQSLCLIPTCKLRNTLIPQSSAWTQFLDVVLVCVLCMLSSFLWSHIELPYCNKRHLHELVLLKLHGIPQPCLFFHMLYSLYDVLNYLDTVEFVVVPCLSLSCLLGPQCLSSLLGPSCSMWWLIKGTLDMPPCHAVEAFDQCLSGLLGTGQRGRPEKGQPFVPPGWGLGMGPISLSPKTLAITENL